MSQVQCHRTAVLLILCKCNHVNILKLHVVSVWILIAEVWGGGVVTAANWMPDNMVLVDLKIATDCYFKYNNVECSDMVKTRSSADDSAESKMVPHN